MDTIHNRMLAGLMTPQEIAETAEKWLKVGEEGSDVRQCAFDILRLTYHIEQARIPNQLPSYESANYDQFWSILKAIRQTYKLTNQKVIDWLGGLKRVGLLPSDWFIPSLDAMEGRAKQLINQRGNKGAE